MDRQDGRAPTQSEAVCFEAGIKFGSLYHQFAGTPVSPESADSLAAAMEDAIENQPHCERVSVEVRDDRLRAAIDEGPVTYTELTGEFFEAEIVVEDGARVVAAMELDDGYPLMAVRSVRNGE